MQDFDQASASRVTEIIGPWLPNKGNEMTLRAVINQLGKNQALAVSSNLGLEELPQDLPIQKLAWRHPATGARLARSSVQAHRRFAREVGDPAR
jgi:hypothetical protein